MVAAADRRYRPILTDFKQVVSGVKILIGAGGANGETIIPFIKSKLVSPCVTILDRHGVALESINVFGGKRLLGMLDFDNGVPDCIAGDLLIRFVSSSHLVVAMGDEG